MNSATATDRQESGRQTPSGYVEQVQPAEVGQRVRGGAVWSLLQVGGRNLLSLGVTAVLARLLSPDDYGLIGMVSTLTALLLVFSDMGLSWATVQRKTISNEQVSNLFWLNTGVGGLFWAFCLVLAPHVADFYARPELQGVTVIMGVSFLLSGLAVQPFALLTRRMAFKRMAGIELTAQAVGALAGVIAAYWGFGYWALVIQGLINQLLRLILALPSSGLSVHRPRMGVGTRNLVGFGGLLALNGLLIYLARNLDNVLIGKYWGPEELGYYGRAYFLMLLPSTLATGAVAGLLIPALSALQGDPVRLGSAYRRALRLVAFVGCPMSVGLALTASEAVQLVYGEYWTPVVPMLIWLSVAGITQPIYNTTGWLFTATGNARAYFVLTVVNGLVLSGAFLWAAPRGALAVSATYGIVMGVALLLPSLLIAHRAAGLALRTSLKDLWPVLVAVGIMTASILLVGQLSMWLNIPWYWAFGTKVLVGVVTYMFAARLLLREMLSSDVASLVPARLNNMMRRIF